MKKPEKNIFGDFVHRLDELNTIQGGVSMTRVSKKTYDWGIELSFRTPGLPPEAYHVEVQGHGLCVFTVLTDQEGFEAGEERMVIPGFFKKFPLSFRTDMQQISVTYGKGCLRVRIPNRQDLPERFPIEIEEE